MILEDAKEELIITEDNEEYWSEIEQDSIDDLEFITQSDTYNDAQEYYND